MKPTDIDEASVDMEERLNNMGHELTRDGLRCADTLHNVHPPAGPDKKTNKKNKNAKKASKETNNKPQHTTTNK